jgi:ABC-type nitrate/sulfonate/bicarbonate transport system substrate-binding protein
MLPRLCVLLVVVAIWLSACAPASSPPVATGPAPATAAPASGNPAAAATTTSAARAASIPAPAVQPLSPMEKVRLLSIGIAAQAPTYLAIERGYFRDVGIEPEIIAAASTGDVVTLLSNGQ